MTDIIILLGPDDGRFYPLTEQAFSMTPSSPISSSNSQQILLLPPLKAFFVCGDRPLLFWLLSHLQGLKDQSSIISKVILAISPESTVESDEATMHYLIEEWRNGGDGSGIFQSNNNKNDENNNNNNNNENKNDDEKKNEIIKKNEDENNNDNNIHQNDENNNKKNKQKQNHQKNKSQRRNSQNKKDKNQKNKMKLNEKKNIYFDLPIYIVKLPHRSMATADVLRYLSIKKISEKDVQITKSIKKNENNNDEIEHINNDDLLLNTENLMVISGDILLGPNANIGITFRSILADALDIHTMRNSDLTIILKEEELEDLDDKKKKNNKNNKKNKKSYPPRETDDIELIGLTEKNQIVEKMLLNTLKEDQMNPGQPGSLFLQKSLLKRFGGLRIRNDLNDCHIYIMKKWLINLLLLSENDQLGGIEYDYGEDDENNDDSREIDLDRIDTPVLESSIENILNENNNNNNNNDDIEGLPPIRSLKNDLIPFLMKRQLINRQDIDPSAPLRCPIPEDQDDIEEGLLDWSLLEESNSSAGTGFQDEFVRVIGCIVPHDGPFLMRANNIRNYFIMNKEIFSIIEKEKKIMKDNNNDITNMIPIKLSGNLMKDGSFFSDGAKKEKSVKINGSIIGRNTIIRQKSKINSSIIMDNVEIGEDCIIQNCIIGNGVVIENGCKLNHCQVEAFSNIQADSQYSEIPITRYLY